VSTDNPVIMFIFMIYSLILYWGNVSKSNAHMKFAQIHYFLSQNVWGEQNILCLPLSKSWGGHVSPLNSVPVSV